MILNMKEMEYTFMNINGDGLMICKIPIHIIVFLYCVNKIYLLRTLI